MLIADHLVKEFKDVTAVNDISFEVEPGRIFGLLGPNGAGKTTTLRMMLGIIRPTRGTITFNGRNAALDFQRHAGYLPEERGLYRKSKVIDVLRYFAELKNPGKQEAVASARFWLKKLDMEQYCCKKIEELSKGNQQKIQLIAAIVHNPEVLILDEPFSGFDPINQETVKELLSEFVNAGKLIILSTHQMEIAENLCSNIFLINKGKEVLNGPLQEIKNRYAENKYRIDFSGPADVFSRLPDVTLLKLDDGSAEVRLPLNYDPADFLRCVLKDINVRKFIPLEPRLHDIFLKAVSPETEGSV